MHTLIKKIRQSWNIKKIHTVDDLNEFLYSFSAKNAGLLIVKYAQKRLGKIHYNLSKDDDNYNAELVRCQIAVHAEIIADLGHLSARLSKLSNVDESSTLKNVLTEAHTIYVNSSPDWYLERPDFIKNTLQPQHFNREDKALRDLAVQTGDFLFALLPLTDNLRQSNVIIFQSQIRLIYIDFLEQLSKRIPVEKLKELVMREA